jgi:hypothetical protein
MKLLLPLFFFIAMLTIISCEFEPNGYHFNKIEKPVAELAHVKLNFEDSVVVLSGTSFIDYSISLTNQMVVKVEIYLDEKLILTSQSAEGSVRISSQDLPIGTYNFGVKFFTNSGSGSVADKFGAEGYYYFKSWKLIMIGYQPFPVNMSAVYKLDNRLRIEWERFNYVNFKSYELFKTYTGEHNFHRSSMVTVYDQNQNYYTDSSYIGGDVEYSVRVRTTDDGGAVGDSITFSSKPEIFSIRLDKDYNCILSWSKCQFASNCSGYKIYRNNWTDESMLVYSTNELNDTSITLPFGICPLQYFLLQYIPSNSGFGDGSMEKINNFYSGSFLGNYNEISQTKFPPYLVYTQACTDPDLKYDPIRNERIEYNSPMNPCRGIGVSPTNDFLLTGTIKFSTGNLSSYSDLNFMERFGQSDFPDRISIDIHGIGLIETNYSVFTYDFKKDTILTVLSDQGIDIKNPKISPNGNFIVGTHQIFNRLEIYSNNGKTITHIGHINGIYDNYAFLCDSLKSQFITVSATQIEKWSCDEFILLDSKVTNASRVLELDPVTNTILTSSDDSFYIYKTDDLSLLKNISVHEDYNPRQSESFGNLISYINSTIFISGYKYKIEF